MCGIALIVDGIRLDVSSLFTSSTTAYSFSQSEQPLFSADDLKAALQRRGPDSLGTKKIFLHSLISDPVEEEGNLYVSEGEDLARRNLQDYTNEGSYTRDISCDETKYKGELCFIGATLQLRGVNPIVQPLEDASGNILAYNGEIFGGIYVSGDENDAEVLMESLGQCCSCTCHEDKIACCGSRNEQKSIPDLLSTIRGPWALVYWQASSKTIWFGRDAFGRRSLLVHWPTSTDPRLLLSSASPPPPSANTSPDCGEECGVDELIFWEELPCAVYSLQMSLSKLGADVIGKVKRHDWTNSTITELVSWERKYILPEPQDLSVSQKTCTTSRDDDLHLVHAAEGPHESELIQGPILLPSETVLIALKEAVMRRAATSTMFKGDKSDNREGHAPIAVLFSGGLDSMILAALLDQCLDDKYEIDLLNVSFDNESAPDRISARAGLKELHRISPLRRWKLVEIDADLSTLISETKHVMSLINPAKTFMDLNIGLALWLAAGGDGWVYEDGAYRHDGNNCNNDHQRMKYKSEARILLVGSGADEQCAGYGRHRTKYRNGSWLALNNEMKLDMQRIWKRNLGRDDRCIADNGKEARFPFLDEDVIKTLLSFPLWEIADLDQPSGKGDKKILREVAHMLGLNEAATLPKRAIQFGTRIARESNRKNFGSNRAANQASAGSVEIFKSSN